MAKSKEFLTLQWDTLKFSNCRHCWHIFCEKTYTHYYFTHVNSSTSWISCAYMSLVFLVLADWLRGTWTRFSPHPSPVPLYLLSDLSPMQEVCEFIPAYLQSQVSDIWTFSKCDITEPRVVSKCCHSLVLYITPRQIQWHEGGEGAKQFHASIRHVFAVTETSIHQIVTSEK